MTSVAAAGGRSAALAPPAPAPANPPSLFADDPSKAYFERFSLVWAPASLVFLLAGVFGSGMYRRCGRDEYLAISVGACVPGVVWPLVFPGRADAGTPFAQRFWVKAAVWIAIFSFYGNYFWTHYFYSLLGAQYLFESYKLNDVPLVTYFCTYFYFTFYFSLTNVVLRLLARATARLSASPSAAARAAASLLWAAAVFALAVLTAVFEAVSVQHFPLYTYTDRTAFLTLGSVVYGIYFMVGFPMFFALDEAAGGAARPGAKLQVAAAAGGWGGAGCNPHLRQSVDVVCDSKCARRRRPCHPPPGLVAPGPGRHLRLHGRRNGRPVHLPGDAGAKVHERGRMDWPPSGGAVGVRPVARASALTHTRA
jgi:cycloeucalenol cycloisomerase